MLRRVEPVTTLFYLCAWYGIVWTLDRLIHWREGRSLIARCGPAFLLILFWSAVGWYAFELINFRLQNWYYIFVLDHPVLQTLNAVFSFATVFPGLLWLEYYLGLRGVAAGWQGRRWLLTPRRLTLLQIAGLIGLALVLLWPRFLLPAHLARLYPALGSHRISPPARQPAASIGTRRLRPADSPVAGRIHRRRSVGILQLLGPS